MTSGVAWSARVSTSRDLLMSQFWQNLHAKLQPAVPKERTAVPGRKWLSGFFSIGSTQNPLDRPQVVSTIRSFSRARTKQSPRCPSSSLQNRGQRSHCTRPLSSACQYFVGTVAAEMGASFMPAKTSGRRGGFPGLAPSQSTVEHASPHPVLSHPELALEGRNLNSLAIYCQVGMSHLALKHQANQISPFQGGVPALRLNPFNQASAVTLQGWPARRKLQWCLLKL